MFEIPSTFYENAKNSARNLGMELKKKFNKAKSDYNNQM